MKHRDSVLAVAAGIATALLTYFGTGLHPIWPLLWFAPISVIAIAPRLSASRAFLLAFTAWLIGETNLWKHLVQGVHVPLLLVAVSFVATAVVFALGVLLVRRLLRRSAIFFAALAFPIYWVTFEYLTESASPHSTYGNLAYTQVNFLPLIQIAAVTGIWGISFIVFLFAGTTATLLSGIGEPRQRRALAIAVSAIICAAFLFGGWRLRANPNAQLVSVTLIAKDIPMSVYLGSEKAALDLLREYADEVRRATPPGTDVVVLPEKIARVIEESLPEVDACLVRLRAQCTPRLISDLSGDRHPRLSILPGSIPPAAHLKPTMTSIISCSGSNRSRPATNASLSIKRPGVGLCKFVRTWIFQNSAVNTPLTARISCSSRLGTSMKIVGCTRAWQCCGVWKMVLPWHVRHATDC